MWRRLLFGYPILKLVSKPKKTKSRDNNTHNHPIEHQCLFLLLIPDIVGRVRSTLNWDLLPRLFKTSRGQEWTTGLQVFQLCWSTLVPSAPSAMWQESAKWQFMRQSYPVLNSTTFKVDNPLSLYTPRALGPGIVSFMMTRENTHTHSKRPTKS